MQWAWPFDKPVDLERFKNYLQVVKRPMDLGTIQTKLDRCGHLHSVCCPGLWQPGPVLLLQGSDAVMLRDWGS